MVLRAPSSIVKWLILGAVPAYLFFAVAFGGVWLFAGGILFGTALFLILR